MVDWAKDSNIYEVNIRQYTQEGSFQAFAKHLPRLKDMGVEILWLMPITPISQKERLGSLGSYYACSSYTKINPEFGNLNDFKQLVDTAHQLGFKLIIDWVANHSGWDHHWTFEHPDWYLKDAQGGFTEVNGWKDVIDLDYRQMAMRQAMIKAMQYWVRECGIDGFRCDMAHLVPLEFWLEARMQCDAIKPLFWLAECDQPSYHQAFDLSYAWNWMHVTEKHVKGEATLNHIHNSLHSYSQYPFNATKLYFTSNHDENSWNGTEYEKYGHTAKAWWVFSATWQGLPLIYSGQEIPNKTRLKFFDKDAIDWNQPFTLEPFFKNLLALRKSNKALSLGETFVLPSNHSDEIMGYIRKYGQQVVLVLLNLSDKNALKITVDHPWLNGCYESLFTQMQYNFQPGESFELMAGDYLVYHSVSQ
ncbi:MAG: 1,4-alpha-glucan branching protein [Sphingobacteriia bacterium 35-40-8]|nr:MAG: 1,4-alpha-glucan branching protein [Sphingobacteriia bacterium 35-40-8]